jgi:hypothetical protein
MDSEIKQRANDLAHMLSQSQIDEIDENILVEPIAKLLLLLIKEVDKLRAEFTQLKEDQE